MEKQAGAEGILFPSFQGNTKKLTRNSLGSMIQSIGGEIWHDPPQGIYPENV